MLHVQHLAHQGEAVGVDAGGGQSHQYVAGGQLFAVNDLFLIHDAHREAGQIVLVHGIEAGHLGGLAAHQGALGLAAALGDAGDDVSDAGGVVLAAGDIVQEEHGGGAAAHNVVDAHGHTVDAHGVVLVHQEGQLQLGAHTVGAGDQHRLFHAGQIGGKHTAEAAQSAHDAGDVGGLYHGLDALDRLISGGDVHAGGGVGLRVRVLHTKTSVLKLGIRS